MESFFYRFPPKPKFSKQNDLLMMKGNLCSPKLKQDLIIKVEPICPLTYSSAHGIWAFHHGDHLYSENTEINLYLYIYKSIYEVFQRCVKKTQRELKPNEWNKVRHSPNPRLDQRLRTSCRRLINWRTNLPNHKKAVWKVYIRSLP